MMCAGIQLTILNSMAGANFESALDQHVAWGLRVLDLKDAIYGKRVDDLLPGEAEQAARAIEAHGMRVETLSTSIFYDDIEQGEDAFRAKFGARLARILESAPILQPRNVRLLSATSSKRANFSNCAEYIADQHPWLFPLYREAIDQLHAAGFQVVIENEVHNVIFSHPQEIVDFFHMLDCGHKVGFTWDIANLWEEGTFPTLAVYEQLKPFISLVHVKGGSESVDPANSKRQASSLEDASWPVQDIVGAVVRDGISQVICLNGSHGVQNAAYSHRLEDYERDIHYLRKHFDGIE